MKKAKKASKKDYLVDQKTGLPIFTGGAIPDAEVDALIAMLGGLPPKRRIMIMDPGSNSLVLLPENPSKRGIFMRDLQAGVETSSP